MLSLKSVFVLNNKIIQPVNIHIFMIIKVFIIEKCKILIIFIMKILHKSFWKKKKSLGRMLTDVVHTSNQTIISHLIVFGFFRLPPITTERYGGWDRSEENANSFMAPNPSFTFFRSPCLFGFCFVFLLWTSDFEHCSLSSRINQIRYNWKLVP